MSKSDWRSQALFGVAILAVVFVSNECYRYVRSVIDTISSLQASVSTLSRDVQVLNQSISGQVKAPAGLVSNPVMDNALALPLPPVPPPLRVPATSSHSGVPEVRVDAKKQATEDGMMNVALRSETKNNTAATDATDKPAPAKQQPVTVKLRTESR